MAQTQLYTKKAQVHVKATATDAYDNPDGDGSGMILCEIPDSPISLDSANFTPQNVRGDFGMSEEIAGTVAATINFRVPLKGSGAAGTTAPEIGPILQMCGLAVTNSAGTSDSYEPVSTFDGAGGNPSQAYSVTVLEDGVAYAIAGAFATATITATVGEPAFLNVTASGAYQTVADDALEDASSVYQTTIAPAFMGATLSLNFGGAYTPVGIETLTIDLGNTVRVGKDANSTFGIYGARITGRAITAAFDPEMVLVATNPYFTDWTGNVAGSFTTGTIGATENAYAITIAQGKFRPPELVTADGVRKLQITMAAHMDPDDVEQTNAELEILFT